jgi:MFS family permease
MTTNRRCCTAMTTPAFTPSAASGLGAHLAGDRRVHGPVLPASVRRRGGTSTPYGDTRKQALDRPPVRQRPGPATGIQVTTLVTPGGDATDATDHGDDGRGRERYRVAARSRPRPVSERWQAVGGLLTAMGCALTAHRMVLVAVPRPMLTGTGSTTETGPVTAAPDGFYLAVQVLAGPVLDRVGARRTVIVCTITSATVLSGIAAVPGPSIWAVARVVAVVGAADGPSTAAKAVVVSAASRSARQPLAWAASLTIAVVRGVTTAGPALAGLLMTTAGGPRTRYAAAALFAIADLAATTLPRPAPTRQRSGYLRELGDGARYLRHDTTLHAITLPYAATNLIEMMLVVLLPGWGRDSGYGAAGVAATPSVVGATATVTALLAARIGHLLPPRTTYLAGLIVARSGRFVVPACLPPLPVTLAVFALAGLCSGLTNPLLLTVQYERIPEQLRGRVQTVITATARAGLPVGGLAGAAVLAAAGLSPALWICAAGYVAAMVWPERYITWQPPTGNPASPAALDGVGR